MRIASFSLLAAAFLFSFGLAGPVQAAEIGAKIPSDLAAHDAGGKQRSFENLTGKKGAVLVFYRSADW
jgi:hypothetical protein